MKKPTFKQFITIFLATIILYRLVLYFIPRNTWVYLDDFHHIYLGIFLLAVYFLIRSKPSSNYLLAVILASIVDQLANTPFYLLNFFKVQVPELYLRYWTPYSVIATTILVLISVFIIKKY